MRSTFLCVMSVDGVFEFGKYERNSRRRLQNILPKGTKSGGGGKKNVRFQSFASFERLLFTKTLFHGERVSVWS